MFKIIELEIDPTLTGDTGVLEVAWVEYPAIEQEMMYFGRQKFYVAPEYVAERACRAIEENEKRGNPAATQTGKIRAQQLCSRSEVSLETIKRMKSYLERARTYDTGNWDDNGTISYALWGGNAKAEDDALTWVNKILDSLENQDLAEVGPRGGIRESEKAPKSDTPNPDPKGEGTAKGKATDTRSAEVSERVEKILQEKSDDFNEKYKDKLGYGVNVGMLKTVYQRGVGAYNTSHSPAVKSAEQWSLARVNAFLYLVKEGRPENKKYVGDNDLLPTGHPKKNEGMTREDFVYPSAGESKDDFISRCIPYVIAEGETQDVAAGKCYGMWENRNFAPDKVSFDWNNTLDGGEALRAFENERRRGSLIYIITALPLLPKALIEFSNKYDIPASRIFAVGSNRNKIQKVIDLGIKRHYDDNMEVRNALGNVGQRFDYDVSALPAYESYPTSGDSKAMEVKPFLTNQEMSECGCEKQHDFNLMGFIDGEPVFSTPEEATLYGESQGCEGYHEHTMDNGEVVYMGCEFHPEEMYDFSSWNEEDLEMKNHFDFMRQTGEFDFEYITSTYLRGYTEQQIFAINHKEPTVYYLYDKILTGEPTRPFCQSLEGRYFRIAQIYALESTNTEFGHNRQPYSKWTYKGGPQCVHAWRKFTFERKNKVDNGLAPGKAGIPPKNMENQGYYSAETKRRSQVAYIISQQNMSEQKFLVDDLEPIGYIGDLPIYDDLVTAQDASFAMGCGGLYEMVEYEGKQRYQACSFKGKRAEKQKQTYAAVEEKRMIYTPLMIPQILIPRVDETTGERYWVRFSKETIFNIAKKFAIEGRNRMTNLEHTNRKFNDIVMVESWIVDGDKDKAYELGFNNVDIPSGTWMGGFYILPTEEGDMVLNDYIKPGKVRGASVEGNFILNFSSVKTDDYLLKQIINILKNISE